MAYSSAFWNSVPTVIGENLVVQGETALGFPIPLWDESLGGIRPMAPGAAPSVRLVPLTRFVARTKEIGLGVVAAGAIAAGAYSLTHQMAPRTYNKRRHSAIGYIQDYVTPTRKRRGKSVRRSQPNKRIRLSSNPGTVMVGTAFQRKLARRVRKRNRQLGRMKRRRSRRTRHPRKSAVKKLSKRVGVISRIQKENIAKLKIEQQTAGTVLGVTDVWKYDDSFVFESMNTLKTDVNDLPVWKDDGAGGPGTIVKADFSGSGQHSHHLWHGKKTYSILIRNNYHAPCQVEVFVCVPKTRTGVFPTAAMAASFADNQETAEDFPSLEFPTLHPKSFKQFNRDWTIKRTHARYLHAGDQLNFSHIEAGFAYNPSLVEQHTESFQRKYGGVVFMLRILGAVGHKTDGGTPINHIKAQVDWMMSSKTSVYYDGSANLRNMRLKGGAAATLGVDDGLVGTRHVETNVTHKSTV